MNSDEPCPRIEALSALSDGELSEPQRLAVQAHAGRCAVCAPMLAEFRQLHARFDALDATPECDVAPEVDRRIGVVAAPVPRAPQRPWRQAPSGRWRWVLLAPGGAVAVSAGLWLGTALMGAALPHAQATAARMAPFSSTPAGSICPMPGACGGMLR